MANPNSSSSSLIDTGSPSSRKSQQLPPLLQPNYDTRPVQEALEHLASIDLIELCNEAKVERCRATRDLRSCGRYVRHVLSSCGHASLCSECSQRCDLCPICRVPIPKNVNCLRLRLYYECIEAGLISKKYDDRFQEKEDGEKQLTADVQRLYLLFDAAMENNLVSLICHYVTDVCMDESAVSSDPVIAFLVDEVAVKDWCKRTFGNIISYLQTIYTSEVLEMKTRMPLLLKFSSQLTGISHVLEVLESSIHGTLHAQHDLHLLQENVLKAKQHLEIMAWSIKHQFLENIKSRHLNYTSWCSLFRERRSAAINRSWPELVSNSAGSAQQDSSTLFIDDALSNLETEQEYERGMSKELEVISTVKGGSSSFLRSKIEGFRGCYPFENLRAAIDILFLCGCSDLVVAKRAIFLYYMFDRHWTKPDEQWRYIIDDFAASFGITRHLLLESLTFYLLDDNTDQALQEVCHLLPEIAAPNTHPKIAQVLLEKQNPDAALMVLRWSGRDGLCGHASSENGGVELVSFREAVIAVRVRVECGLLTEAFMYQRVHCLKVKEDKLKRGSSNVFLNGSESKDETWVDQMNALVTELCCLCIRRNLVDRMIELPWNSDEEIYIHKCLLDYATECPTTTCGSLLVVYYLQRFRYVEAYQVKRKLQELEQDFISKASASEKEVSRIRSTSLWRAGLVDKCIELLPDVEQQQVKTGKLCDFGVSPSKEVEVSSKSNISEEPVISSSLLPPVYRDSSLLLDMDSTVPSKKGLAFGTPAKAYGSVSNSRIELSNYRSPSILHGRFLKTAGESSSPHSKGNLFSKNISTREVKYQSGTRQNFKVDDIPSPGIHLDSTPLKEANRGSLRVPYNDHLQEDQISKLSPGMESNSFLENARPQVLSRVPQMATPVNNNSRRLLTDLVHDSTPATSHKRVTSERPQITSTSGDESMDFTWSNPKKDKDNSPGEDSRMNGGLRWRSDESSEDEGGEPSPEKIIGRVSKLTPSRGAGRRRSRFARG